MLTYSPDTDRFIPSRAQLTQVSFFSHSQQESISPYQQLIQSRLCPQAKLLNFSQDKENLSDNFSQSQISDCSSQLKSMSGSAEKVLDAPGVRDDFYLNLIDWSPMGPLGIALDNEVYLYTPNNIVEICRVIDESYVSSVKFCGQNPLLSVGFSDGKVRIFDMEKLSLIRTIEGHNKRVSGMDYSQRSGILYTGSKDRNILLNDLKQKNPIVGSHKGHRGQICAIKTEKNNGVYFASGSNDNSVRIWDSRRSVESVVRNTDHKGAVKALDWCPWKNGVIATAGGSGDRTIRIWSAIEQEPLSYKKTDTQISSLLWNENNNMLLSSHGCPSNEIISWKLSPNGPKALTLSSNTQLKGHTSRILQMVQSPNSSMLCSVSADQTIRFWRVSSGIDPWSAPTHNEKQETRWSFKLK